MVDSLPPSGTAPDNETISTNSNDKLSVPLDGETLDVGSSGKVKAFETTKYLASFEDNHSGDWTGIEYVSNGIAKVQAESETKGSASVTADLTGIDKLNFRIDPGNQNLKIFIGPNQEAFIGIDTVGYKKLEISGLDQYGPNTTITINSRDDDDKGLFRIDYIRTDTIKPESRKIELCDAGGT